MLKKILPVGIGLVLILLIAVGVYAVKQGNNKTPEISNANSIYLSYVDDNYTYGVTNARLYNTMKKNNGTAALLNLVDEKLFAKQLSEFVSNDDFVDYVFEQIFETSDESELLNDEDKMDTWNELVTSFRLSHLLTKAEAAQMTFANKADFTKDAVKALANFNKVSNEYKLAYVRNEWAKEKILANYIKENKTTEDAPVTDKAINDYYLENYKSSVNAIMVAFQSEKEAKAAMKANGINTTSSVLSGNSVWVKNTYDYYTDYSVDDEDKFVLADAVKAFVNMYNTQNFYLGKSLNYDNDFTTNIWYKQSAGNVSEALVNAVSSVTFGTSFELKELTYKLIDLEEQDLNVTAKVTMELTEDSLKLVDEENGIYTGKDAKYTVSSDNSAYLTLTVKYTIQLYDADNAEIEGGKVTTTQQIKLTGTNTGTTKDPVITNTTYSKYVFNNDENTDIKAAYGIDFVNPTEDFVLDENAVEAISSTLSTYLTVSSTSLQITNTIEDSVFYTVSPVSVGNYYFLLLKLADNELVDLYTEDEDKNLTLNSAYADAATVKQEIVDKIIEDLYTENNINDVIYQNRREHKLNIYDKYLEAIYDYSYTYFYETTLSKTKYNEYEQCKKNQSKNVASICLDSSKTKKKNYTYISADELFTLLVEKYGISTAASFVESYMILADTNYNNIYNPYTKAILDNNDTLVKNLLISETSYQQKYFEQNLFTKTYSYYYQYTGIIPNFSSKYGWSDFLRDYFGAYSDYEFLTSSAAGATVYSDAANAYLKDLYLSSSVSQAVLNPSYFTKAVPTLTAEIDKARNDFYGAATTNLIIELDVNNDGTATGEEDNWDKTGVLDAAKALANLMYDVAIQTNCDDLICKLEEVCKIYNEASCYTGAYDDTVMDIYSENFTIFGWYKYNYGFKVIAQSYDYDADASYVQEYNDATQVLYNIVRDTNPDMLGKSLDTPVVGDPFTTIYGVHKIAVTHTEELVEDVDDTLINIYLAKKAYEEAKESYDSAKESADSNTDATYTNIANARLYVAKYELDKAEAAYQALIGEATIEDYEIDEDKLEALEAWVDDAVTAIGDSTLLSMSYCTRLKDAKAAGKITCTADDYFNDFIEVFQDECSHEE